jgi:hypothetical protein
MDCDLGDAALVGSKWVLSDSVGPQPLGGLEVADRSGSFAHDHWR